MECTYCCTFLYEMDTNEVFLNVQTLEPIFALFHFRETQTLFFLKIVVSQFHILMRESYGEGVPNCQTFLIYKTWCIKDQGGLRRALSSIGKKYVEIWSEIMFILLTQTRGACVACGHRSTVQKEKKRLQKQMCLGPGMWSGSDRERECFLE